MSTPPPCRLCGRQEPLRVSHFMPAALYPKNKQKVFATKSGYFHEPVHIAQPMLCGECDARFNQNGEDEVLRWLGPKTKTGQSPLDRALEATPARSLGDGFQIYAAADLKLKPESFAYFALSLIWRSEQAWPLPDDSSTAPIGLGEFEPPIRAYLLGEAPFPEHAGVAVTCCTDPKSRQIWAPPEMSVEVPGLIVMPIMGLLLRVWLGRVIPAPIHRTLFFPSTSYPIFKTECWDVLGPTFSHLFDLSGPPQGSSE